MSACIKIPFWPVCVDNLRWSSDNLIAVAGSDSIAIVMPKSRTSTNGAQWEHITVKVNGFTHAELPLREPLSFINWSLGEELSNRHVIHLDWSSRGLGCFDTCVLAVLHSDYALDLWEYRGQPQIKDNWVRCLVLTNVIHDFYETIYPSGTHPSPLTVERQQVRQRIRSIAWSPQVTESSNDELYNLGQNVLPQTAQLLAIATEAGDILITRIVSPYNTLAPSDRAWQAMVIRRIPCYAHVPTLNHIDGVTFNMTARGGPNAVVEQLVWGQKPDTSEHMLAFIAGCAVYTVHLEDLPGSTSSDDAIASHGITARLISPLDTRVEGPMRLSADGRSLLCFADDALLAHELPSSVKEQARCNLYPVDRRWSEMSGLVSTPYIGTTSRVMFTTHLEYERLSVDQIVVPPTKHIPQPMTTTCQESLRKVAKDYRISMELNVDAHTRTSGIAAAPTSSHVAICASLLPADSPAHIIQSDHECSIFINELEQTEKYSTIAPQDMVDFVVFYLQHRLARSKDDDAEKQPDTTFILDKLVNAIGRHMPPPNDANMNTMLFDSPLVAAVHRLRRQVLDRSDRKDYMLHRLLGCVLDKPYTSLMPTDWCVAFIEEFVDAARGLAKGELSQRILDMHQMIYHRLRPGHQAAPSENVIEYCSVCHESMPLEAIKWSRCSSGHRFVRCALTFLTIPRPGLGKYCGICGAQYLNEQRLLEFGTGDQSAIHTGNGTVDQERLEPAGSAARVLFSVFCRCISCGGRFTV